MLILTPLIIIMISHSIMSIQMIMTVIINAMTEVTAAVVMVVTVIKSRISRSSS